MNKQCICDNYQSYRSTLKPGVAYAMLMQPDDCVNCYQKRTHLFSLALGMYLEQDPILTTDMIVTYVEAIKPRAWDMDFNETDLTKELTKTLSELLDQGIAQKYVDLILSGMEK